MTPIEMPKANENLTEATLNRWLVKEGDVIVKDQSLCELITDKAQGEIFSPVAGTVLKIFGLERAVLPVGYILCVIGQSGTNVPTDLAAKNETILAAHRGLTTAIGPLSPAGDASRAPSGHALESLSTMAASGVRATPAARRLAKELGVNLAAVAQKYNLSAPISEKDIKRFSNRD
ncbi:MAG: biotin/lipoyl-containing protein [Planctomycetota bacterium]